MKGKWLLGVLAVMGILVLSTTAAQAGAGGTPSALTSFFVCHGINGDDAGQRVDVQSSALGFNPLNVRIGNATLACAFAKLYRPGGDEISPNPANTHEALKCYSISVSRQGTAPPARYTFTDELSGLDADVLGSSIQYICGPASFSLSP